MNPKRLLNSTPVIFGVAALVVAMIGLGLSAPRRGKKPKTQATATPAPLPTPDPSLKYTKIVLKYHIEGSVSIPTVKRKFEDYDISTDPEVGIISIGRLEGTNQQDGKEIPEDKEFTKVTNDVTVPYHFGPKEFVGHVADIIAHVKTVTGPLPVNLGIPKPEEFKRDMLDGGKIAFHTEKIFDVDFDPEKIPADKREEAKKKHEKAKKNFEAGRPMLKQALGAIDNVDKKFLDELTKLSVAQIMQMMVPSKEDANPDEKKKEEEEKAKLANNPLLQKVTLSSSKTPFTPADPSQKLQIEICVTVNRMSIGQLVKLHRQMKTLDGKNIKSGDKTNPLAVFQQMDQYIEKIEVVLSAPPSSGGNSGDDDTAPVDPDNP